jgi:hypothetical protein
MTADVLIAIPAFNEAATIGPLVAAARVHAPVLVIDDGSADGTAAAARAAGATVMSHALRRGKGAALATALTAARLWGVARVVTLDADGQHDPADLPTLLAASAASPLAIVVGARLDDAALPTDRALAIRVAGFWLGWITGASVTDTQSGFRVYPTAVLDAVRLRGGRFVFETAVLAEALRRGWQVREVPIRVVPFAARASRFHPLADGLAIAGYLAREALARWAVEGGVAVRELARVFSRERRVARHSRMFEKASPHAGTPSWGLAIGVAAAEEVRTRAVSWWHHPRARRARRGALATLATPLTLALVAVEAAAPGALPRVVRQALRRIYDQRALPALEAREGVMTDDEPRAWATVAPR